MKANNIILWIASTKILLMKSVMPALPSQTERAKEGINYLSYPEYFGKYS